MKNNRFFYFFGLKSKNLFSVSEIFFESFSMPFSDLKKSLDPEIIHENFIKPHPPLIDNISKTNNPIDSKL